MFMGLASRITRLAGDPPSLALDLARSTLDGRLSFSRASSATDVIDGVLTTFTTDAPRCSASNGLLLEEARTNSLRNAAGGGSTAGVIGSGGVLPTNWAIEQTAGLTTQVVSASTVNGFSVLRLRVSGTPSATSWQLRFEGSTQVAAAQNQVWSASLYAALAAGTLSNISACDVRCAESTAVGVFLNATDATFTPTATLARVIATRTLADPTAGAVNARLRLNLTISAAIDITLDIAAPQLEQGAFATSYIHTTTAAATRAADACTMATGVWFSTAEGTLFADATTGAGIDTSSAIGARVVRVDSGNGNGLHEMRRNPADSTVRGGSTSVAVSQSAITGPVWANGTRLRMAYAYKLNDMALVAAGGTVQTDPTSPDGMPTGLTTLRLGAAAAGSGLFNGHVRAVRYWPRRLSNPQLKAMTT